jgi:hypothetical protein
VDPCVARVPLSASNPQAKLKETIMVSLCDGAEVNAILKTERSSLVA